MGFIRQNTPLSFTAPLSQPLPLPSPLSCFIYWQKSESFEWLNVAALLEGPVSPLPPLIYPPPRFICRRARALSGSTLRPCWRPRR